MKKIVREFSYSDEQLNNIFSVAKEMDLTPSFVKILYARGIDNKEKINRFLHPCKDNFYSPFLLSGMKEAVALLQQAKAEEWRVAIFGDYDADGVCASTILYRSLISFGIQPSVYVPERTNGYGLNIETIDKIFDEVCPDLFITVDCGISNAKEVEYIQSQGAYVIVTDHHELPPVLPQCVCINPKFFDDYPYDNLCGAGVAFKVGCALLGEKAYSLLDFAALATVADSVPLLGENRDIVFEGIKKITENPRPCFSALIGKNTPEITAQTLAFNIAPRINAAGRMGDANSALKLFIAEDTKEIYNLAIKLSEYNLERQKYCDQLYDSAKKKIREKGAYGNVIMLWDESWNTGFIGIVAARIAEEYCRPTLLFVKNGEMLKGSARSIESINIYDALKNCSDCIFEFGGHSQAAGINLTQDNFSVLEKKLNEYIGKTYCEDDFTPKVCISEELEEGFSKKFAHELLSLEPYGVGHRKPLFLVRGNNFTARPIKPISPHLSIRGNGMDLMYFGGIKQLKLIESDVEKQFIVECNVSTFREKEYIKGFVRDVLYDANSGNIENRRFSENILRIQKEQEVANSIFLSEKECCEKIENERKNCKYGLCVIVSDLEVLQDFAVTDGLCRDLFSPSTHNVCNTILISPAAEVDLGEYNQVVFLQEPVNYAFNGLEGKNVFVNKERCGYKDFLTLDTSRGKLLEIFSCIRQNAGNLLGENFEDFSLVNKGLGFSIKECMFATAVFEELNIVRFENGRLVVYRGVKSDLSNSKLYCKVLNLQESFKREEK